MRTIRSIIVRIAVIHKNIKQGEVLKIPLVYHYGVSAVFLLFFRKITKKSPKNQGDIIKLAASPGLEPRLTESESAVLPLDDEAFIFATSTLLSLNFRFVKYFYKKLHI